MYAAMDRQSGDLCEKNTANQRGVWKMKRITAFCLACIMLFVMLPTTFAHAGACWEPRYDEDYEVFSISSATISGRRKKNSKKWTGEPRPCTPRHGLRRA